MAVTGLDQVVSRLKLTLDQAKNEKTEKAITEMLIIGGGYSHSMTPIDSSTLINSQGRITYPGIKGWAGSLYYGASYAGAVNSASGKLKGKPRAHFGSTGLGQQFGGGSLTGRYWDPDAEPHFLEKGMEEMAKDVQTILKKHYAV